MRERCSTAVEVGLDLWPLVADLVPLLEEIERIEREAAGLPDPPEPETDPDC